jgi:ectoine hydroxylase-related dioxygenase (phytanoyl-CoA dioxygenase family)
MIKALDATAADCVVGPTDGERAINGWSHESTSFKKACERFNSLGAITIPNVLSSAMVDQVNSHATADLESLEGELQRQSQSLTADEHHRAVQIHRVDFREIVKRDGGRIDMRYKLDQAPYTDSQLAYNQFVFPLMKHLLGGEDVCLLYMGVMFAKQSTETNQKWHGDGGHIFSGDDAPHLPCHCINVFIPLVDLVPANGPTEFAIGTHVQGDFEKDQNKFPLCASAGSAVIFDYRLKHRGARNTTPVDRPILYMAFSRPWFKDVGNSRSYLPLVPASKPWRSRLLRGTVASSTDSTSSGSKRQREEATVEAGDADTEEGAGEHWILFEMAVQLNDETAGKIRVHSGDVPEELAAQFVREHELPQECIAALAGSIAEQISAATKTKAVDTTDQ